MNISQKDNLILIKYYEDLWTQLNYNKAINLGKILLNIFQITK